LQGGVRLTEQDKVRDCLESGDNPPQRGLQCTICVFNNDLGASDGLLALGDGDVRSNPLPATDNGLKFDIETDLEGGRSRDVDDKFRIDDIFLRVQGRF
jgi:hypothetical protein